MGKLVGARYAIVGEVYAYGITEGSSAGKVGFVELLPPPGIRDPKVAFKRLVPQGETFRVIGVEREHLLLDSVDDLLIVFEGSSTSFDVQQRISLMLGNEGSQGAVLNPRIYRKLDP